MNVSFLSRSSVRAGAPWSQVSASLGCQRDFYYPRMALLKCEIEFSQKAAFFKVLFFVDSSCIVFGQQI